MKLTIVLLTAVIFSAHASGVAQSVTLTAQKMPLQNVFKVIEKQTGYSIFYNDEYIRNAGLVTVNVHEMPLRDFLGLILKQDNLSYEISRDNILIKRATPMPALSDPAKPVKVSGTVTGDNNQPLSGATVQVKGQVASTVTDAKGNFQITVDQGATIVISYVGYQPKEIKINNSQTINITLDATEQMLGNADVVTTGYQVLSKERSAGAFSKPDMLTIATRSSSPNILQRLDGLVPGLVINNAPNGQPLLIRGLTSVNSTKSPLIIVDGVELPGNNTSPDALTNVLNSANPIANINPQDIADITVLKDASAASIWGAKAANGVIVITTKKGRAGENLKVEYDGYYIFQGRPDRGYIPKLNSQQYITAAREIFPEYAPFNTWGSVQSVAPVPPHLQVQYDRYRGLITQAQADKSLDSLAGISNSGDVSDIFYRRAATTNHTVSISGGTRAYTYYGSLSYTGIQNNVPGQKNNSYKINLRQDVNVNTRVQISFITDLTNTATSGNAIGIDSGIAVPDVALVPYQRFRNANGNPLAVNFMGKYSDSLRQDYQARSRINLDYVPVNEINAGYFKGNVLSGRIVGGAKVTLLKSLRFEGTYGYSTMSSNTRTVLSQGSYGVRNELLNFTQAPTVGSVPQYWLPATGGRLTENNATQKNWTVRDQLIFDQSWNEHQLTVLAGQEATSITPVTTQVIYRGWDDQLQLSRPVNYDTLAKGIDGTVTGQPGILPNNLSGGEGIITRTTSYYSSLSYAYLSKYVLNGSWRIDKSNLFGFDQSAQNRPVWSVGGKWMLAREKFMTSLTWLDRLDLRLTYGITGNAPTPGTAASFDILLAQSNVNYVNQTGYVISTPANSKLTWEGTSVYNTGLDFSLMGGRLAGSIDGYLKKTHDLIGPLKTAPLTGYATVTGNFGDLENKGIELLLNSLNVVSKNFFWRTTLIFGYNRNKITELAASTPITTGVGMIATNGSAPFFVGRPAYTVFAYNYAGLNSVGDPQIRQADGKVTAAATASTAQDVLYMGSSQPSWTGGLFNTLLYKRFQLSINITYNMGHVLFRDANTFWSGPMYDNSMSSEFADRWKAAGDEAKTNIPRYAGSNDIANNRNTDYYSHANSNVFNASYAKIREITLSYNLGPDIVRRLRAEGINFRVQVSNLMLWKANHLGIDPEFQSVTGARSMRTGQGAITIGAHITL
ncbi:SusC/RagA family TonB-linked outer membrane protein [Flavitalea sp. BT771]|uniref:SusC/RagA family TonB-linked outer membrane protein n=1 Tax=Flavitalea sp. BT771 TaxID=3063329 RepID=UPI0026E45250|nr:SusC/RagA family TonB-linked outer membrane protein [Flavitalea sp. BT771]MDO6430004.1 SusC/RagA family TonB-linked outer membrane protein [Flavitalea sp. BT771]MDV6217869.1 SusC/RagA family TonB-linked outer membrane protein [Flavitalea sp. BT771]